MLDKETSEKLYSSILERIDKMYPSDSDFYKTIHNMAEIAIQVSIITLQEYEKLNQ